METYPNEGDFQRRDFCCKSDQEAVLIACAVYGAGNIRLEFDTKQTESFIPNSEGMEAKGTVIKWSAGLDAERPDPNDIHVKISSHIAQYLNGQEWCHAQTQQRDVYS